MAGDKKTGVCLQAMVKKLDAGDIIASYEIAIDDSVNALELLEQLVTGRNTKASRSILSSRLLHLQGRDNRIS